MSRKKILILKNDRSGDLFISLKAIYNIIDLNQNDEIHLYLSYINKSFSYLFKKKNIKKEYFNYRLSVFEKFKIFKNILINKYEHIYILSPKNFYYFLPLFFRKIKFYATCVENVKNRPSKYLRKYLYKYNVNNRIHPFKKLTISELHGNLVSQSKNIEKNFLLTKVNYSDTIERLLNSDYLLFRSKAIFFKKHNWKPDDVIYMIEKLSNLFKIYILGDFEDNEFNRKYSKNYYKINININNYVNDKKDSKIIYFENLTGYHLCTFVNKSQFVLGPHGITSNIARFFNIKIFDFFDKDTPKNSFHEYRIKSKNYNFLLFDTNVERFNKKFFNRITKFL